MRSTNQHTSHYADETDTVQLGDSRALNCNTGLSTETFDVAHVQFPRDWIGEGRKGGKWWHFCRSYIIIDLLLSVAKGENVVGVGTYTVCTLFFIRTGSPRLLHGTG